MATLKIDYPNSKLGKNMEAFAQKIGAAVLMYAGTKAIKLESQMKRERPWTDRTGMAKATLRSVVTQPDENTIRITLAHGVDYGKWLELAHEKKWAIVAPTLEKEAPNIISELADLMSKINF